MTGEAAGRVVRGTAPSPARRLLRIVRVVVRYRLDELVEQAGLDARQLPLGPRLLWWLLPRWLLPRRRDGAARRLRLALEDLGPVFVKFGQILSTRRDLLREDFADELKNLQDNVPPFPGAEARRIVEAGLGTSLDRVFESFDETPIASASVAQVHGAVLREPPGGPPLPGTATPRRGPDGVEVIVKVIRPGIEPVIADDVALLRSLATLLERYSQTGRRLHLLQVVDDYEATIQGELDLVKEAENTARLKRNFIGSPLLYVPEVHQRLCSASVLVEERIFGIPIWDVPAIRAAGTNMQRLAEVGVETFFTQVFEDNFFHADMHPGNIFVDVTDPQNPNYIAIDCAICGTLTDEDQDYLARNIVAFFRQDYAEVARLHVESGWIPPGTNPAAFEKVIRDVCTPIFQKPLKEISFGTFLLELFRTAQSFDMEVQPQLVLLQKTLLNIEGLGRQLYPDLDLWQTAQPFMERWMAERVGPLAAVRGLQDMVERLPELPALLGEMPRRIRSLEALGQTQVRLAGALNDELRRQRSARRTDRRIAFACLVLAAGALWYVAPAAPEAATAPLGPAAGLLALAGGLLLLGRS